MKKKLHIVKIGGNVIDHPDLLNKFLKEFSDVDGNKILIHGGGKLATTLSKEMGVESKMVDGRRITDEATLKIVTMVYAGWINKTIVASLQKNKCNALGLTGADGGIIKAAKRSVKEVDYGFVGDTSAEMVNSDVVIKFLESNFVPIIAPITHDNNGQLLNTNADTVAAALAVALSDYFDVHLLYCFEKKGVLSDVNNPDSLIGEINPELYKELKQNNVVHSGMLPKLDNAFNAIETGVTIVSIGEASNLLGMIARKSNSGTVLKAS